MVADRDQPGEKVIATTEEGGFFGDMALVLEHQPLATIVAKGFTECLVLTRRDFKDIVLEHQKVIWNILEVVAKRLASVEQPLHQHR